MTSAFPRRRINKEKDPPGPPCTCQKPSSSGLIMCRLHRVFVPGDDWPPGPATGASHTDLPDPATPAPMADGLARVATDA